MLRARAKTRTICLRHRAGNSGTGKHDHVVIETDAPARIVFTDPRRFGLMTLIQVDKLDDDPLFAGLGIEPLSDEFDAAYLKQALQGKKRLSSLRCWISG